VNPTGPGQGITGLPGDGIPGHVEEGGRYGAPEGRDDAAGPSVTRRVRESIADLPQTVLIVDDDPRMRAYIRDLLGTERGVRILGEARDGEEAIRLVQQLRPEVVLMDLGMPRMGGLDALRRTKREMPWTKVIMVTVHGEDAYRRAAIALGADGFIVKKRLQGELLPILRRIA